MGISRNFSESIGDVWTYRVCQPEETPYATLVPFRQSLLPFRFRYILITGPQCFLHGRWAPLVTFQAALELFGRAVFASQRRLGVRVLNVQVGELQIKLGGKDKNQSNRRGNSDRGKRIEVLNVIRIWCRHIHVPRRQTRPVTCIEYVLCAIIVSWCHIWKYS